MSEREDAMARHPSAQPSGPQEAADGPILLSEYVMTREHYESIYRMAGCPRDAARLKARTAALRLLREG